MAIMGDAPSTDQGRAAPARGRIIILGCGGHGRVCGEMAELLRYQDISFLDLARYHEPGRPFEWPIRGSFDQATLTADLAAWRDPGTEFLVALGENQARLAITRAIEAAGLPLATLIHPTAFISPRSTIGRGSSVCAGAIIQLRCSIGMACLVNTAASVDHDGSLGAGVHLSPGVRLSGRVTVGEGSWLGTGVAVRDGVTIAGRITVGVGAAVVDDLSEPGVYVGVPARRLRALQP
jgi:sugar O-acyltransferase (sialic acid O-acetyltransferase NeuD family)